MFESECMHNLICYSFVKTRGTPLTSWTTIRAVSAGSIDLYLIFDVLRGMSIETHWRSQLTVHMDVEQAAVGAIYVAIQATRFGWLVVTCTKQCV